MVVKVRVYLAVKLPMGIRMRKPIEARKAWCSSCCSSGENGIEKAGGIMVVITALARCIAGAGVGKEEAGLKARYGRLIPRCFIRRTGRRLDPFSCHSLPRRRCPHAIR